ncbi:hypothetical protein [Streptomyces sp. NPDC048665]|uniref:hypothetical protein n=1 Tax=Streptomyces sp. NPDC048665 TaxID=3155490 RepID=UPI0034272719
MKWTRVRCHLQSQCAALPSSLAAYEHIDRATLQRRLLLALFALGTDMGIRAIVATREHGGIEAASGMCAGTSSPSTTAARPSPVPSPVGGHGGGPPGRRVALREPGASYPPRIF